MKAEEILLKNALLFQEHPFEEMYVKDNEAILKCMEDYHKSRLVEIMPTESEINEQAELHFDKHTIACRTWIGGAKWLKNEIEKCNK